MLMQPAARGKSAMQTLFDPGRNCWRVLPVKRAAVLIDADNYYNAFVSAALRATSSIIILAWDFDSRTRLRCDDAEGSPPARWPLPQLPRGPASRPSHLRARLGFPAGLRHRSGIPPALRPGLDPRRRVHLRYDNTHPVAGSHHQKIVVIDDGVGFSGGLDLTSRRWDTCEHRADDPRRVCAGEPYPPFHDVMAMVDGEAAQVARRTRPRALAARHRREDPDARQRARSVAGRSETAKWKTRRSAFPAPPRRRSPARACAKSRGCTST